MISRVYFCHYCEFSFDHLLVGRIPLFCSAAHRQANYRKQKKLRIWVDESLDPDLSDAYLELSSSVVVQEGNQ